MNAVCKPQNSVQNNVLRRSVMLLNGRNIKCKTVPIIMIISAQSAWDSGPAVVKKTLTVITAALRAATTLSQ